MKSYEKAIVGVLFLLWLLGIDNNMPPGSIQGSIILGAAIIYHAITKEKK